MIARENRGTHKGLALGLLAMAQFVVVLTLALVRGRAQDAPLP